MCVGGGGLFIIFSKTCKLRRSTTNFSEIISEKRDAQLNASSGFLACSPTEIGCFLIHIEIVFFKTIWVEPVSNFCFLGFFYLLNLIF